MKFLIVSAFPPPLGGSSVHAQRLLAFLNHTGHDAKGLDVRAADSTGKPADVMILPPGLGAKIAFLLKLARTTTPKTIVHFQISAMNNFKWVAPIFILLFWRQPKLISIRSGSFPAQMDGTLKRLYLRLLLHFFRRIVVVTAELKEFLVRLGIPANKLVIIPGFIPQIPDRNLIPPAVMELVDKKTIVVTSGYLTEPYNYDVLIDCAEQLDRERYAFVFCFYGTTDVEYEAHILERLAKFENVLVLRDTPPEVFVSIMSVSSIYVRATLVDGDSNAVREAQHFGKVVFASTVVKRPDGCLLFSPNDSAGLLALFKQDAQALEKIAADAEETPISRMLRVYEEVNA